MHTPLHGGAERVRAVHRDSLALVRVHAEVRQVPRARGEEGRRCKANNNDDPGLKAPLVSKFQRFKGFNLMKEKLALST